MDRMFIFLYEIGRDTTFDRRVNNLEGRNKIKNFSGRYYSGRSGLRRQLNKDKCKVLNLGHRSIRPRCRTVNPWYL